MINNITVCRFCGKAIKEEFNYCPWCGVEIIEEENLDCEPGEITQFQHVECISTEPREQRIVQLEFSLDQLEADLSRFIEKK